MLKPCMRWVILPVIRCSWGDIIHGPALQLDHPEICATYDMDQEAAVAARKHMLRIAREQHLLVAGMHLPEGFLDFRTPAAE